MWGTISIILIRIVGLFLFAILPADIVTNTSSQAAMVTSPNTVDSATSPAASTNPTTVETSTAAEEKESMYQ